MLSQKLRVKVTLEIDGTKHIVLLKEIARDPASKKVQHLSFQALVADEMVNSIAHVVIHNRDMVMGLCSSICLKYLTGHYLQI